MMIAIIVISENGKKIAKALRRGFPGEARIYFSPSAGLNNTVAKVFDKSNFKGIVFIMSLGIVSRIISKHLKNKFCDPAVVVVDEAKRFAISALSGHEGGANELAVKVANVLGAEPVITTASEAAKKLVIGVGCRRGIKKEEIIEAIEFVLKKTGNRADNIRFIATIDLKQAEKGLNEASRELGIPLRIISSSRVRNFNGKYHRSSFVKEKIGVEGVSEPCALIAAGNSRLILPKRIVGNVTVAVAREV